MTIEELEAYFSSIPLPKEIQLHPAIKIIDVAGFVKKEIAIVRFQGTNVPAYERLLQLKAMLDGTVT